MTQTCSFPTGSVDLKVHVESIEGIHEMLLSETCMDDRNTNKIESTSTCSLQLSRSSNIFHASHHQETIPLQGHGTVFCAAPTKPTEQVLTTDVKAEITEHHEKIGSENNFHFGKNKDNSVNQKNVTSSLVSGLFSPAELSKGIKPEEVFVNADASQEKTKQKDDTRLGNTYSTADSLERTISSQNAFQTEMSSLNASLGFLLNSDGGQGSFGMGTFLNGNNLSQGMILDSNYLQFVLSCQPVKQIYPHEPSCQQLSASRPVKKTYSCAACSKEFLTKRYLKTHMRIHTLEKPYICELCGKAYQDQCGLKSHVTRSHSGLKPFICQICNKSFAESRDLKSHMLKHSDDSTYSCIVCSKDFKRKNDLRIHMFVHTGDDPVTCQVCDKSFATRSRLKTHMVIHSGDVAHKCEYCDKSFSLAGNLKAHVDRVHNEKKNFSCVFCNKTFGGKSNLKKHLLLHTGEKPHVCDICKKGFRSSSHLKDHARTHTGETPYVCEICNKHYKFACSYKIHMRIHTGIKLYKCDHCQKHFTHQSNLKRHTSNCIETVDTQKYYEESLSI